MHLVKIVLTSLCLLATTSAYTILTYAGPNCTGRSKEVIVRNSSCHVAEFKFKSVKVVGYSSKKRQKAVFYKGRHCYQVPPLSDKPEYHADGSDGDFKIGKCIDFHNEEAGSARSTLI